MVALVGFGSSVDRGLLILNCNLNVELLKKL
jgi:hypothetical protein